jgi:GWxTD domain-containing protein
VFISIDYRILLQAEGKKYLNGDGRKCSACSRIGNADWTACRFTPNRIEAILFHELAHIRRWDYPANALQRLVEGIIFYPPAVWWISAVIRSERENCCDDVAVAMSGCPYEYAAALAALEQNRRPCREPAVAASGGNLVKRIRRLLVTEGAKASWAPLLAAIILITTAALALAAWQSGPSQTNSSETQGKTNRVKTSPYSKWLDQEIVYIITREECAAFQKLTTNEERDKFFEQFWSRRDPTPGTIDNEFKVEHYRRIAYADERFRTQSGKPGWQTDRGHLYIVYGPPDEIETHPKGIWVPIASEAWMYRHLEGIGENVMVNFLDKTQTEDYRLTPESLSMLKPHLTL